jgi:hypothetical protein
MLHRVSRSCPPRKTAWFKKTLRPQQKIILARRFNRADLPQIAISNDQTEMAMPLSNFNSCVLKQQ